MSGKIVAIGADHAGFELKHTLLTALNDMGFSILDFGTNDAKSVDYPEFADAVSDAITAGDAECGVLVCGSGIGMSIRANRHAGVRAALCHDEETARLAREHNDANILVLGARVMADEVAIKCAQLFFATSFDGGERHVRRVAKLA